MNINWNDIVEFEGDNYTVAYVGSVSARLITPIINLLDSEVPSTHKVIWVPINVLTVKANILPNGLNSPYYDLTAKVLQGKYEHKKIDYLTKPGIYKLPFKFTWEGEMQLIVKVVKVYDFRGLQGITIEANGKTYGFQYNGVTQCFYPDSTVSQSVKSINIIHHLK